MKARYVATGLAWIVILVMLSLVVSCTSCDVCQADCSHCTENNKSTQYKEATVSPTDSLIYMTGQMGRYPWPETTISIPYVFYTIGESITKDGKVVKALVSVSRQEWSRGQESWIAQMVYDYNTEMNLYTVARWKSRGPIVLNHE